MSAIELVLPGKTSTVGDFTVVRALPQVGRRFVGPFCFVDHMGPHTAVGAADAGVGPHPHIGLATITWLFSGEVLHRDSLGTAQVIRPGDVNWMTAGRGIVHSERTPAHLLGQPTTLHGLQVWLGLPLDQEESAPSFHHVPKAELPASDEGGVSLRVVAGAWRGARSPVRVASPTLYVVAELQAGAALVVSPESTERAVYVVDGSVRLGDQALRQHELGVLRPGTEPTLRADAPSRVAIIGGEPLDGGGQRFMKWNFVSSRRERLEQAASDWKHRRFPLVPGDEHARTPMPGEDAIP